MTTSDSLHEPRPVFDAERFTFLLGGHGAAKLSSSAVAPLVAAARGYTTITAENLREEISRLGFGPMNSGPARQIKKAVNDLDALVLPWYRMDEVFESARSQDDQRTRPSTVQLRPAVPVFNSDGEPAKYVNLASSSTVLDAHPATPASWFQNAPTFLFTEGIMKGDAALTALLREHGISDKVLSNDHGGDQVDAKIALRKAMEKVPEAERVVIISFVGVHNWTANSEWTSINLRGRAAWVAYDADTASNRLVWKAAAKLFQFLESRRKTQAPRLVTVPPVAGDPKAGLDDFLAATADDGGGTWADLPNLLRDLPDEPSVADGGADPGTWRVNPEGTAAQESEAVTDSGGNVTATVWRDKVPLGGRIKSIEIRRAPSDAEIRTGRIGEGVGAEGMPAHATVAGVEVEVKWADRSRPGFTQEAVISGPATILNYVPKEWERHGAEIPTTLLRHSAWPPKEEKWLAAIKDNRPEDVREKIRWETMGWVPTDTGTPVFIVGEQAIGAEGSAEGADIIGVTDHQLPGSSDFGVIAPDCDFDDDARPDAWQDQARADLEEVFEVYLDSGAWTDEKVAATVLAIALRPCLPIPCKTAAYFTGPRRKGKSFTAGACMSFWQPRVGTWSGERLPGAAKDTIASTEFAVSRTPIWVADDLAPSMSKTQALSEEAAIGDLIRSIHNRSGKRRMNANMSAREVNTPKALLIATAENEPSVSSVADRVVLVTIHDGSLSRDRGPTDGIRKGWADTGVPARLTSAFIRWFAWKAEQIGGWNLLVQDIESHRTAARAWASDVIAGKSEAGTAERHAQMASDLTVTFMLLAEFAEDIGASNKLIERLDKDGLPKLVALQVAAAHDAQKSTSPGHAVLEAVSALLRTGRAHVSNADAPDDAPSDDTLRNSLLGWASGMEEGQLRRQGHTIGWLTKRNDTEVVLLDPRTAFNEAQAAFPELIPFGSKQTSAWSSMWDEGLTMTAEQGGWKRRTNGRHRLSTVDARATSTGMRISGVPVALDVLVGGGASQTEDAENGEVEDDYGPELHVVDDAA